MPDQHSDKKLWRTMPNGKAKLLVESLSTRLVRTQAILIILGRREGRIAEVQKIISKIRDDLEIPMTVILAGKIPEIGTRKYQRLIDSHDLILGLKIIAREGGAACLMLDARNSGAYVVLIDNEDNEFRVNVNLQLKTELPGMVDYILDQASRRKNGNLLKKSAP
jgi:hypothetical protein